MALEAGSITINGDLSWSGSGLALPLFEISANKIAAVPDPPYIDSLTPEQNAQVQESAVTGKRDLLNQAKGNAEETAEAIITYLVENAEIAVTITTADAGLQTLPDPLTIGTPTAGPTEDKTFTGALT